MRTYEEVKKAVLAKGYKFYVGHLNINLIFERTSNVYTNEFTDLLHIVYQENKENKIISLNCTTKPGLYGGHAVMNPKNINGVTGVACIVPGQYLSSHSLIDNPKELSFYNYPFNYPFLGQIKALKMWRDFDKDNQIDKVQEQSSVSGINFHIMSQKELDGTKVNNWSEGCFGCSKTNFNIAMSLLQKGAKIYGPKFTITLMETNDFK